MTFFSCFSIALRSRPSSRIALLIIRLFSRRISFGVFCCQSEVNISAVRACIIGAGGGSSLDGGVAVCACGWWGTGGARGPHRFHRRERHFGRNVQSPPHSRTFLLPKPPILQCVCVLRCRVGRSCGTTRHNISRPHSSPPSINTVWYLLLFFDATRRRSNLL